MSLIRDEDCFYIIRILTLVSYLSHCYHRSVSGAVSLWPLCCAQLCVSLLHLTAWWSWTCAPYVFECATLCVSVLVRHHVLCRATSQLFPARWKQSVASKQQSWHDNVRRPSQEATTVCQMHCLWCLFINRIALCALSFSWALSNGTE